MENKLESKNQLQYFQRLIVLIRFVTCLPEEKVNPLWGKITLSRSSSDHENISHEMINLQSKLSRYTAR